MVVHGRRVLQCGGVRRDESKAAWETIGHDPRQTKGDSPPSNKVTDFWYYCTAIKNNRLAGQQEYHVGWGQLQTRAKGRTREQWMNGGQWFWLYVNVQHISQLQPEADFLRNQQIITIQYA
ncbi:hypothetical protein CBL_00794 [Carabus blaptoides fortunei]